MGDELNLPLPPPAPNKKFGSAKTFPLVSLATTIDCKVSSDEVCNRHFLGKYENYVEVKSAEDIDLCPNCYEKRQAKEAEAAH